MEENEKYRASPGEAENVVLPNKMGITQKAEIEKQEAIGFIDAGIRLTTDLENTTRFDVPFILKIHKMALGPLYSFAGKLRTVNLSKGGFVFPAAKHLDQSMADFEAEILSTLPQDYSSRNQLSDRIADVHAELLFIHPFREGNGRTARLLANLMAYKAGYNSLKFERLSNEKMFADYISAVQKAGSKEYGPMREIIASLF